MAGNLSCDTSCPSAGTCGQPKILRESTTRLKAACGGRRPFDCKRAAPSAAAGHLLEKTIKPAPCPAPCRRTLPLVASSATHLLWLLTQKRKRKECLPPSGSVACSVVPCCSSKKGRCASAWPCSGGALAKVQCACAAGSTSALAARRQRRRHGHGYAWVQRAHAAAAAVIETALASLASSAPWG